MIFKKLQNINEDFDFGSVEIESSAASSYNQTPEMVRTITNRDVDPLVVLNGLFKCKTPYKGAKYKYIDDHAGTVYASQNYLIPQYGDQNITRNYDSYYSMHARDVRMLELAGFKKFVVRESRLDGIKQDWAIALLDMCDPKKNYKRFTGDQVYFSLNYMMSPDNGLVIVTYLSYKVYDSTTKNAGRMPLIFPTTAIMFTGDVIYKINQISYKDVKTGKQEASNLQKQFGFLNAIVERSGKLKPCVVNITLPVLLPSGNMVYIINRGANESFTHPGKIWPTYRLKRKSLKDYMDPSKRGETNNIVNMIFTAQRWNLRDATKSLIFKYTEEPEQNVISGIMSKDDTWVLYSITDKNVLRKLLGSEIADKFNDNARYANTNGICDLADTKPIYQFFFITNTGMKYYNAMISKKINLTGIKNGNEPKP